MLALSDHCRYFLYCPPADMRKSLCAMNFCWMNNDRGCSVKDEGLAPRNRLAGAGFKPVYAALVKSWGRERYIKSQC